MQFRKKGLEGNLSFVTVVFEDLFVPLDVDVLSFFSFLIATSPFVKVDSFTGQLLFLEKKKVQDVVSLKEDSVRMDILFGDLRCLDAMFFAYGLNAWEMDFQFHGEPYFVFDFRSDDVLPTISFKFSNENKSNIEELARDMEERSYLFNTYNKKMVAMFRDKYGLTVKDAVRQIETFMKYEDIGKEFIQNASKSEFVFPVENAVSVQGQTAKSIYDRAGGAMTPLDCYNRLVYLREHPESVASGVKSELRLDFKTDDSDGLTFSCSSRKPVRYANQDCISEIVTFSGDSGNMELSSLLAVLFSDKELNGGMVAFRIELDTASFDHTMVVEDKESVHAALSSVEEFKKLLDHAASKVRSPLIWVLHFGFPGSDGEPKFVNVIGQVGTGNLSFTFPVKDKPPMMGLYTKLMLAVNNYIKEHADGLV